MCSLVLFLACTTYVLASELFFTPSAKMIGLGEEFYVDLMLDPENTSVNGIESTIVFPPDKISFVRSEEGKSMVDLWIEKTKEKAGVIAFSGIISGGFSGVIDPFYSDIKSPGLLVRLVFRGERPGDATIESISSHVAHNDGEGTTETILPQSVLVSVENKTASDSYKNIDETKPELVVYVIRDQNIFNNKYTLVIQANDKESGIRDIMVKEGGRDWQIAESPYLLEDQDRGSTITIRATNHTELSATMTIDPTARNFSEGSNAVLLIIFSILLLITLRGIYSRRRKSRESRDI